MALTGVVLEHEDLHGALSEICRIAVRAIPAAESASLTSLSEAGPLAVAASDEWSEALDQLQHAEREGPCLDAARTGAVFRVRDMAHEQRWPSFAPKSAERGVGSMVSLPLASEGKTIGALNVYSRATDAFDAEAVTIAEILAGHASLASQVASALFHHRQLAEQLREAMVSRATIEQAKGVLMAQSRVDADTAFDMLRSASQHQNRKLRDLAREIVRRQADEAPQPDTDT